jgi:steroid delta-isomerase-like uncharacterized protein
MATETTGRIAPERAREWMDRFTGAWNSHDADRLLALATEDVRWEDPFIVGGALTGKRELREWLEVTWRAVPDLTFTLIGEPFISLDGASVAYAWHGGGHFTGPMDPPGFAPTGEYVEMTGVDIHEFEGDLVSRVQTFTDAAAIGRQIGALPEPGTRREKAGVLLQKLATRGRR